MYILLGYDPNTRTETKTRLALDLAPIDEHHPKAKFFVGSDPKFMLMETQGEELVLAPGAFIVVDGRTGQPTTAKWDTLSASQTTAYVRTPASQVPPGAVTGPPTYMHVRVDGGPDRRYSNNPSAYVVEYKDVILSSSGHKSFHFRFLTREAADLFSAMFGVPAAAPRDSKHQGKADGNARQQRQEPKPPPAAKESRDPYEVLQVPVGSDAATIRAAYVALAKQYHPDKVAHLAQEFRQLAEEKMKEINRAYAQLRRD